MRIDRFSRLATATAAAVLALALVGTPRPVEALPDIVPVISDLAVVTRDVLQGDVDEGCAGGRYGRRLVSFSLSTRHIGADDLILGNPGCPNCGLDPGATCTNPLFVCDNSQAQQRRVPTGQAEFPVDRIRCKAGGPCQSAMHGAQVVPRSTRLRGPLRRHRDCERGNRRRATRSPRGSRRRCSRGPR